MSQSKNQTWLGKTIANWQEDLRLHGKSMLKSGLGYGLGLVLGAIVSKFLFNTVDPDWIINGQDVLRLITGLILAFVIMAIGGGIAGGIGGMTLPLPENARSRRATAIISALEMGVLLSLLMFPIILVVGMLSYYDVAELRPRLFGFVFGLVGLLFGALLGLWLGSTTLGKWRRGRVMRATSIGFGIGGFFFGICAWFYLYTLSALDTQRSGWGWVLLGLFAFGSIGGSALGLAYSRLSAMSAEKPILGTPFKKALRRYWLITVILILAVYYLRPVIEAIGDMITPQSAGLASILPSQTIGTRWNDPSFLPADSGTPDRSQPALFSVPSSVILAWKESNPGEIFYTTASHRPDGTIESWQSSVNVSASPDKESSAPQVVSTTDNVIYLAWVEAISADENAIHVARCQDGVCASPWVLSAKQDGLACSWTNDEEKKQNAAPRLAINGEQIMVTWNSAGQMLYSTWTAAEAQTQPKANCLPLSGKASESASLATGPNAGFSLAYAAEGEESAIYQLTFDGQVWSEAQPAMQANGNPALWVDVTGKTHLAWCGLDEKLYYQQSQGNPQLASDISCFGKPVILNDSQNSLHLLWASQEIVNAPASPAAVVYESKLDNSAWQPAALVFPGTGSPETLLQFAAVNDSAGVLHLAWPSSDANNSLGYAAQIQYSCPDLPEDAFSKVVYQAAEPYRDPQSPPPYCGNRYERLIFAPNPEPAFSEQPPSPNGVFDKLSESIMTARYEVLLSTMWFEADLNQDSPGAVVASAVADLYHQVEEHPENYPRGMTVRILLGNPPEVVVDETSDQLWSLLNDLHNAGVDKMEDPEIGWKVEAANFEGALPHSHSKMLIVDGESVVAAGFNFEYYHFPLEHPSGLGEDRWDLAMQFSGPVAQDAMRAFDDLWQGSNGKMCDFDVESWESTCQDYKAVANHIPEVLKYYIPGGKADAFSMYRTEAHAESDAEVVALLSSANESVDLTHVNFTLTLVCDLNILYDVCNFRQALPYYESLLKAAENGAHLRIMVEQSSIDGVEATIGLRVFLDEAARRGLSDQIEVRFFNGWMHFKTTLVDDQFLVVGSQNYHYSAFGNGNGLAEYNLGTNDPQAIEDYKRFFEYQWERAIPYEE